MVFATITERLQSGKKAKNSLLLASASVHSSILYLWFWFSFLCFCFNVLFTFAINIRFVGSFIAHNSLTTKLVVNFRTHMLLHISMSIPLHNAQVLIFLFSPEIRKVWFGVRKRQQRRIFGSVCCRCNCHCVQYVFCTVANPNEMESRRISIFWRRKQQQQQYQISSYILRIAINYFHSKIKILRRRNDRHLSCGRLNSAHRQ